MNKLLMTSLIAGLFLFASVMNADACGDFQGRKGPHMAFYDTSSVSPETLASFNKETASLRERLIDKSSELRKEQIKTQPDLDTMAKLQKEMIDLKTEIQKIANKYGIVPEKYGRGKGRRGGGWK
jgi:hypothetical protein